MKDCFYYILGGLLAGLGLILGSLFPVWGMDIEPQVRWGGLGFHERGIDEGHKAMIGLGAKVSGNHLFNWSLTPELWFMSEPIEEDSEIPNLGICLLGEFGKDFKLGSFTLEPWAGFYSGQWHRNSTKYNDSWTRLNFFDTTVGINLKYQFFYGKLGLLFPTLTETNHGKSWQVENPTPIFEVGILYENISFAYFYRKLSSDYANTDINLSGMMIGYKF
jgi:hypothetical protein